MGVLHLSASKTMLRLAFLSLALVGCISGSSPETVTISQDKSGNVSVTVHRPGVAEQALSGVTQGATEAIANLFK